MCFSIGFPRETDRMHRIGRHAYTQSREMLQMRKREQPNFARTSISVFVLCAMLQMSARVDASPLSNIQVIGTYQCNAKILPGSMLTYVAPGCKGSFS
jgi:hypothetical protein